ncbi:hypothetical protein HDU76_009087, partial [Blyttiomyces sp. JEL0837]
RCASGHREVTAGSLEDGTVQTSYGPTLVGSRGTDGSKCGESMGTLKNMSAGSLYVAARTSDE